MLGAVYVKVTLPSCRNMPTRDGSKCQFMLNPYGP